MTTILSLPPEILLQVFEFATDDPGLLDHTPSWKHYDLSSRLSRDVPWLAPGRESERTAMTLGIVCRYWRPLATGLELRHVRVYHTSQLQSAFDRLSGTPDVGKSVKRITLRVLDQGNDERNFWKEEDAVQLIELLKLCPNLEVFTLDAIIRLINSEQQDAGEIILRILASFCVKLKRLHWRGGGRFDVPVSGWASALSSLSFLEALEIDSETEEIEATSADDYEPLCLTSLRHFRVSTPDEATDLLRGVSKWELPSLTNLYLAAPDLPCYELLDLFSTFSGWLKSLSLDANTSLIFPMDLLAETSIEQLEIYNVVGFRHRPSTPLPSISTVALRLFVDRHDRTVVGVRRAMRTVAWITKESFAQLETVVVIGHPIEDLDEPCQVAKLGESEDAGLACERWDQQGVRVVNRRGIRVLRLTTDEITHTGA